MRAALLLAIGCAAFIAITYFEQLPILGWLGGVVSIAAWVALTRALVGERSWRDLSSAIGLVWAAVLGVVTGFVGAFTAWLAQTGNLVGFTTPPGDRVGAAFGFIGASIGIILWPLTGALVCVVTAVVLSARR